MNPITNLSEDEIIERKLHFFINKYYGINMFQGLLIALSIGLIILLGLVVFGNTVMHGNSLRNLIKIGGGIIWLAVIIVYIVKPLAQRFGIIKGLNFKEASNIINQKHQSIEDKIINIIELTQERTGQNNILYDYAIAQKTENIKDFNFNDAISFKKLIVFLIRLAVIISVCSAIFIAWPGFVKRGIGQMWSGSVQIENLNRITFTILNDSLEVESGKDFLLRFTISSALPIENVSIKYGTSEVDADRKKEAYEFLFRAVNSSVTFHISCDGTESEEFELKTLNRPEIGSLKLKIIPPGYTGMQSVMIDEDGNAEVPSGSSVYWTIKTVNTDDLIWMIIADSVSFTGKNNNWNFNKKILKSTDYEIICKNNNGLVTNYNYRISIVTDLFPTIDLSESRDSTISDDVYIQGVIQDDYGFSKLEIIENKLGRENSKEIEIKKSNIYESFYYTIVPDSINTIYYFRIWDNDVISGPKFTESRKISLKTLSKAEIESINNQLADSIEFNMLDGINAIDKMEKKISEFKIEQITGDLKPWEIQEKMKELVGLKEEVMNYMNEIKDTDKKFTENEDLLNRDKEFTEKAKQIKELMENLLDDELKDLLKQFEELAKEYNAKKSDELTEKMEMNLDKLKEQMEMSLELLKKYDMEKDLIKQMEQLNQMADSLDKDQKSKEEESQLKDEFKKWEDNYNKKIEENEELKKPMKLESLEPERDEVRKAADELSKIDSKKAAPDQKIKVSRSLRKLAKKMGDMMDMAGEEGENIDLEDIRQIRNSLNDFSKKQEDLNNAISKSIVINSSFTSVIKEQKVLEEKFTDIRDSLKGIGYKQPVIARMIGQELFHVETSFKNLFENFDDGRVNIVGIEQNSIMSEINSIAIKLDELIRSLQDAKGKGSGKKGFTDRKKKSEGSQSGSEKLGETQSMQQSLKDQLKSSIQQMKEGANGKKEREGLGKMLSEREMMRKALEKILQEGGIGNDTKQKANEALNMMKEVEKDIIYNRLGDQTLEKDNLIKTKLLEAENAEKERENENKRESREFKGSFIPFKNEMKPGTVQNKNSEQLLRYNELKLKRFYQEKYLRYIESTKK